MSFPVNPLPPLTCPFKQGVYEKTLSLPNEYPGIEQVQNTTTTVVFNNQTVVPTPTGTSPEGQILTGYKLIVEGTLNLDITYLPDHRCCCHCAPVTFTTSFPFTTFIILPATYTGATPIPLKYYIEHAKATPIAPDQLYTSVVMLLVTDVC